MTRFRRADALQRLPLRAENPLVNMMVLPGHEAPIWNALAHGPFRAVHECVSATRFELGLYAIDRRNWKNSNPVGRVYSE